MRKACLLEGRREQKKHKRESERNGVGRNLAHRGMPSSEATRNSNWASGVKAVVALGKKRVRVSRSSRGWLLGNGHDPRLVKHVHIPRARALIARHTKGRVAFEMLDGAKALARGESDIVRRDIVVMVDEMLRPPMDGRTAGSRVMK